MNKKGDKDEREPITDEEAAESTVETEDDWSTGEEDGHRIPTEFIPGFEGLD